VTHETDRCGICGEQAENVTPGGLDGIRMNCLRCGQYELTGTALSPAMDLSPDERARVSGWVFEQNSLGTSPTIDGKRLRRVLARPLPRFQERANKLLLLAVKELTSFEDVFEPDDSQFIAATYSKDASDVEFLRRFLASEGYLEYTSLGGPTRITPQGFMRAEELGHSASASAQGFVAMWFDEAMKDAYTDGFELGISNAGYDPIRVDRVEHVGKIDDEIIAQIRKSRFVVADFTKQRGGVYFEAGFAMGLDLPVIWTCRKDDIPNLHFDIRQFNRIDWETPQDLAVRLRNRIEAVLGEGPRKSATDG